MMNPEFDVADAFKRPDRSAGLAGRLAPGKGAKTVTVKVSEIAEFAEAADGCPPAAGVGEPRRRMNIDCMSEPQHERLRRGFRRRFLRSGRHGLLQWLAMLFLGRP